MHLVKARKASRDKMRHMNLWNRVMLPLTPKDVLDIIFIDKWIRVYLRPLADVRSMVTPCRTLWKGKGEGGEEKVRSQVWSNSKLGSCHTLKSHFPCPSWPHKKAKGWVATERGLRVLKCLPRSRGRPCALCWNLTLGREGRRWEQLFETRTIFVQTCDVICWWWQLIWQWPVI